MYLKKYEASIMGLVTSSNKDQFSIDVTACTMTYLNIIKSRKWGQAFNLFYVFLLASWVEGPCTYLLSLFKKLEGRHAFDFTL